MAYNSRGRKLFEYALYKGEEILAMGTAQEIGKELGVSEQTIYHYGTPVYKERTKGKNGRRLVKIEGDEIE